MAAVKLSVIVHPAESTILLKSECSSEPFRDGVMEVRRRQTRAAQISPLPRHGRDWDDGRSPDRARRDPTFRDELLLYVEEVGNQTPGIVKGLYPLRTIGPVRDEG